MWHYLGCRRARAASDALLLGTVIVSILVLAEEFSQIWIPGRDFELLDLSADLIGIACGDLIARRCQQGLAGRPAGLPESDEVSGLPI